MPSQCTARRRPTSKRGCTSSFIQARIRGIGRVVATKRVAQVEDASADPAYSAGDPMRVAAVDLGGVRTILDVPMLKDNEVIGAIAIYREVVRPFTDKQISWCRISPPRPSSPSRTRGCSTNCGSALAISPSRWSSRRRPREMLRVISNSLEVTCSRCSIRWPNTPPRSARPKKAISFARKDLSRAARELRFSASRATRSTSRMQADRCSAVWALHLRPARSSYRRPAAPSDEFALGVAISDQVWASAASSPCL